MPGSAIFNWAGYTGDETLIYELVQTGTTLKLVVTSAGDVWIWQGTEGMTWSDTNTGAQWGIDGSADTAAGQNLVLQQLRCRYRYIVRGGESGLHHGEQRRRAATYVFASDGTGKIAQGTLTKRGEGKLTLNLDNTGWAGAISIQQGELVAQVANSLGSGAAHRYGRHAHAGNGGRPAGHGHNQPAGRQPQSGFRRLCHGIHRG